MCRKIWNFLGNISLSFKLLMVSAAMLFTGSIYSNTYFEFFKSLNETTVQSWMTGNMPGHLSITWWLPILFITMSLLGLNTFICACNRMASLFHQRKQLGKIVFIVKMLPSAIHFLFLVILFGHLTTFTLGTWTRIPIEKGKALMLGNDKQVFTVRSVHSEFFPETTNLQGYISGTRVILQGNEGAKINLSFLKPAAFRGSHILLESRKKRKKEFIKEQRCDVSTMNGKSPGLGKGIIKAAPFLQILIIKDPGLFIILTGFTGILLLMPWYFIMNRRINGN